MKTRLCLAYHVIRNAPQLIGLLTPSNLSSFLYGATYRAVLTTEAFPKWRIEGVLPCDTFWRDRFGIDIRSGGWRRAVDTKCLEQGVLLSNLGFEAEAWHENNGVDEGETAYMYFYSSLPLSDREAKFWEFFKRRPVMHYEDATGWGLYCFLSGMTVGGDWLSLPRQPLADQLFASLKSKSSDNFGTPFAAFRTHATLLDVLKWADAESQ